jgi:hypothetical protein
MRLTPRLYSALRATRPLLGGHGHSGPKPTEYGGEFFRPRPPPRHRCLVSRAPFNAPHNPFFSPAAQALCRPRWRPATRCGPPSSAQRRGFGSCTDSSTTAARCWCVAPPPQRVLTPAPYACSAQHAHPARAPLSHTHTHTHRRVCTSLGRRSTEAPLCCFLALVPFPPPARGGFACRRSAAALRRRLFNGGPPLRPLPRHCAH